MRLLASLLAVLLLPLVPVLAIEPRLDGPLPGPERREIPNLALRAQPRDPELVKAHAHEGKAYWKARREAEARKKLDTPPPEMLRAVSEAVYRERLKNRVPDGGPQPLNATLAAVGWRSLGPTTDAGRVRDYSFTADGSRLYVATANGGIWRLSRQGGAGSDYGSPVDLTDDLPLLTFGAVAVAPSNPNRIYAATGEQSPLSGSQVVGFGTLRSDDAGSTWSFNTVSVQGGYSSLVPSLYSYDLDVSPQNPDDVLLGTFDGIFRSTDGGRTWVRKLAANLQAQSGLQTTRQGVNFARVPGTPSAVWAGLWGGLGYSINGGETWDVYFEDLAQQLGVNGIPIRSLVAISPANPSRIYWFVAAATNDGYSQLGVFRSDNGGTNWGTALGPPAGQQGYPLIAGTQGWSFLGLAVDPTNANRVFAGGLDMWRSEDAGVTWTQISDWQLPERHRYFCHADIDTLAFEPNSPNLWIGSDGGLFRTVDNGRSFIWKNDGVVARMFSSLSQHPTDAYRLYAGTQDNGTMRLNGNSSSAWKRIFYGDGYDCAVNYQNPSIVYATNFNNYTSRADDGGEGEDSFKLTNCAEGVQDLADCNLPPVTTFRSRLGMDPVDPKILYAMTDRIYRATNGASTPDDWKPVFTNYFCDDGAQSQPCPALQKSYASCSTISVDPKNRNRVAFGTAAGYVVYTVDGFGSGQIVNLGAEPNAIAWHPTDPRAFYVGLESARELVSGAGRHTIWLIGGLGTQQLTAAAADSGIGVPITYAGGAQTYNAPIDSLAISPTTPSLMFAGSKYGIFRSTNAGGSWARFGDDFPATWVSALLFSPDGTKIRAATWGRGMWEINPQGGTTGPTSPPTPAFTFSPSSPRPGQTISFTDQSTGGASAWSWNFGDGSSSSQQNPTKVYTGEGSYNVSLAASNAAGSRSASRLVDVRYGDTGTGTSYTYLLPVVLTSGGAGGTFFTTEATFANRAGKSLSLTFRFKDAGSGAEATSTFTLPAGQQIRNDVIDFLRSTGMSIGSSAVGSLRIEVRGADNLSQFGAQVRVTTPPNADQASQGIRGRFGLSFPAFPLGRGAKNEALVYALQQTSSPGQAGTRSNLACVHAGGGSNGTLSLQVSYRDGDSGALHSSTDSLSLSPFQFQQLSQPLAARGITNGYAIVKRLSGDDQFVCYGVLNDNLNGDGAFVPMVVNDTPSRTSAAMVPVIVDTATFKSEMTIANRTSRNVSGLFALLPSGDPAPEWGYFNLEPGQQGTEPDIMALFREIGFNAPPGTVASVFVQFTDGEFRDDQSDTAKPIPTTDEYVGVRTYASRNGGLFGLAYGYTPLGTAADTEAYVYGLQQTGVRGGDGTRSNLAVLHALGADGQNLQLEVTYYGPDGRELGKEPDCNPCTLQAGQWRQFNGPLERYGVPHGFARVRRVSGTDQFLAYGVLNDQANDDGSYVPMIVP